MNEIELESAVRSRPARAHRSWKRRTTLVIGVSVALTAGLAGGALALGRSVWVNRDGVTMVDTNLLAPLYQGKVITSNELAALQAHGRAGIAINSPALACQGVTLYVDTDTEAEAYGQQYRNLARATHQPAVCTTNAP